MSGTVGLQAASAAGEPAGARPGPAHVALLGNPNTGKTTLFNRLTGLRHKTSNFPGTTLEARVGRWVCGGRPVDLTDLPGIYSLELDQMEAGVCREVLAGRAAPQGLALAEPDAVLVVADATNLARNLVFAGEALRRRLPTVVAVNMADLARKQGVHIDAAALSEGLGCPVVLISARTGEGLEALAGALAGALATAAVPTRTPPGDARAAR
ncbi:MAG: 50S ribosome-binding GTPase, partial [Phycisphaeraceae bacterium]|nr:50S ribosome-binding GTPase [Phycisphaeraceae bacterium]